MIARDPTNLQHFIIVRRKPDYYKEQHPFSRISML